MLAIRNLISFFLVLLLGICALSVNPAFDAGFNKEPPPIYAGSVSITAFNNGTGPRNVFLFFDGVNAAIYNASYVYVNNVTDGLVTVSDVGPATIYLQTSVQYGATWSLDESSPVLLNLVINGMSAVTLPLINYGASSTYSVYKYINYVVPNNTTIRINLQYNSNDSPQFNNFFLSLTPML